MQNFQKQLWRVGDVIIFVPKIGSLPPSSCSEMWLRAHHPAAKSNMVLRIIDQQSPTFMTSLLNLLIHGRIYTSIIPIYIKPMIPPTTTFSSPSYSFYSPPLIAPYYIYICATDLAEFLLIVAHHMSFFISLEFPKFLYEPASNFYLLILISRLHFVFARGWFRPIQFR